MTQIPSYRLLTATFAALVALALPAAADTNGKIEFQNNLSNGVTVKIKHTNGKKNKSEDIAAGSAFTFTFVAGNHCPDKARIFTVENSSGAELASGKFRFTGDLWGTACFMKLDAVAPADFQSKNSSVVITFEKFTKNPNTGGTFTLASPSE